MTDFILVCSLLFCAFMAGYQLGEMRGMEWFLDEAVKRGFCRRITDKKSPLWWDWIESEKERKP